MDKASGLPLYQAFTEDVILQVAGCKTAKELWESLKKRHVGEEKVQQARLQSLMIGFQTLQMKEDDTVDAFTAKLNGYATKAKELGKTLDESLLVRKLLDSTPDKFIQIVASIEQTSDLDDITLDEITGKLKAFEEIIKLRKGGQVESQENLLFAHGEHSRRGRRFGNRRGRSNFSRGNWQRNRNKYDSKEEGSTHKGKSNRNKREWDMSKIQCHKCGKLGHFRKNCKESSTTQEQSNLILEYEEPSLLMATHETEHKEILLNEGQIQPGKYATTDASIWNHEQKIVSDVYYIPNLKSNILSLGQLTEIGCKIIMDGNKLTLYDKNKKLLMKVERSKNRLYNIRLQIEAPICLLANVDNQAWLWHARLGHLNFDDINKMTRRSKNPLDLVYGDLCGPISPATHSEKKLIFLLVDDCTRFMWAYFLTSKDQAFDTFKEFRQQIETEIRLKLRMLRTEKWSLCQITIPHLRKLYARSIPMVYLGVEEDQKHTDYMIQKEKGNNGLAGMLSLCFVVEGVDNGNTTQVNSENNDNTYQEQEPITASNSSKHLPPNIQLTTHTTKRQNKLLVVKQSRSKMDLMMTPYNVSKFNGKKNNAREVETENLLFTEEEPRNYKEASTDKKWIEAMEIELDSINKNNTWTLTTLPTNHKAIGLKWVYKTKRDAKGEIIKYKARLVAKGYVQEQGIDFDEVFAPVARIETVRLILALAAYHGWQVHHLDVKSAFLHGDLKEEVYVTQPEGFIQQGNSGKVYKLTKALYGLRQAPRAWNVKLDQTLKSLDFKKCNLEQAVYTKRSKTSTLIVGVYVDDLIITGTPRKEIDLFKSQMKDKFEMSDLGLLAYYLGIEVN
ncbi:zinc finger, CCHC-type containing protein [Tanacetum coccineum]